MNKVVTLHEAAQLLEKANPQKGDYNFYITKLLEMIEQGDIKVVDIKN